MQFIKFKINVTFFKRNNKVKLIVKLINIIIELIIIEYINIIIANEKEIFKKEIKSIKNYYNLCNEGKLINNKIKFRKKNHPKVSLVIALYNKEKYLLRLLRSIQNQYFKDIEIIFVDDFSTDNGINLLKSFQKEDKRINIIRNKRNKGTLISRIIGIFKTKGDYIMVPDADDMIGKDIIKTCYDLAVKYNYEMIRFNVFTNGTNFGLTEIGLKLKSKPIYQPELSDYLFYGFGNLNLNDFTLWNKFIKEDAFKRAINNIDPYFLNQYMIIFEDGLINFSLYRTVKSFYLIKKIGYYYIFQKENSVQHKKNITKNLAKYIFLYIKFILNNSKNNKHEKDMALHVFQLYKWHASLLYLINRDYALYKEVINFFLNYEFINCENKKKFKRLKQIINKKEKKNDSKIFEN